MVLLINMKRYLLIAGPTEYTCLETDKCMGSYDSYEEADEAGKKLEEEYYQVVDLESTDSNFEADL